MSGKPNHIAVTDVLEHETFLASVSDAGETPSIAASVSVVGGGVHAVVADRAGKKRQA